MTRSPQNATELKDLGAEVVQGDLLRSSSLVRACDGVTSVVASAHSVFGRGNEASKNVDLQGHKDLIDAAVGANVKHFVYLSAYDFGPQFESVPFFKIKRQVERYLEASGLNYTILRPTFFMESYAWLMTGQPILEEGKVTVYGKGENPRNMVAADDVAYFAARAIEDPAMRGATIDIGGLDNVTIMQIVQMYQQLARRQAKVSHVPLTMLKLMYPLLRPIHPGLSQIMQVSIYADTLDCTFDAGPLLASYSLEPTRLEDWVIANVQGSPVEVALA
jgi:NADH dehydrogenase